MKLQENGMIWKDTDGNKLLAHGGHILLHACTKDFEDGFDMMTLIGDETCFDSQAAFILTIKGSKTTSYIYVGDRWLKRDMPRGFFGEYSGYVWFPLVLDENGKMTMIPCKELDINVETGELSWSEETVSLEH